MAWAPAAATWCKAKPSAAAAGVTRLPDNPAARHIVDPAWARYTPTMAIVVDWQTKPTCEDYVHVSDDGRVHELIDGDHSVGPAPGTRHQRNSRHVQHQPMDQLEMTGKAELYNVPTDVYLCQIDVVQPALVVIDLRRTHSSRRRRGMVRRISLSRYSRNPPRRDT